MDVNSNVRFCFFKNGFEYFIEAKAIFTKQYNELYVDMRTDYKLTEIKVNDFLMESLQQVSEFIRIDSYELERQIKSKLVEYADELPF